MRAELGAAALTVAGSVGYASAGTVEFLVAGDEFFFMEMNTRLQVEHAVTEAVTGRDLVADQLRVAAGEPLAALGLTGPPVPKGHAIEARLYAEDPAEGFLPATGRIAMLRWPKDVRVDTGIAVGDEVTERYDPMIAKLVAHGATRDEALARLRTALDDTLVLGVRTNLAFLRWLLGRSEMISGEIRTDTIAGLEVPATARPAARHWRAAAALLVGATAHDPWGGGWRLNAPPRMRLVHEGTERAVEAPPPDDPPAAAAADGAVHVDVDGQSLAFSLARPPSVEEAVRHATASGHAGASVLVAPMPGRVIAISGEAGSRIEAHQPVVVIEAMKMEHAVTAPAAGTLVRVLVREGQQVQRGELLAEVAVLP
jgi:acetyl/propionyl-CoA carboxylase alpha subunit